MGQVIAVIITGIVTILISILGAKIEARRQTATLQQNFELQEKEFRQQIELQKQQLAHDLVRQEARLREELRTEYKAEDAIVELLRGEKPLRRFDRIKDRIGGFDDEELRRLLVRAGALKYKGHDGSEMWALRDRYSV